MILFLPLMLVFVVASMVLQELFGPFVLRTGSSTLELYFVIPWVMFYALSLAVPYPLMLFFALVTGFLWDATLPVVLEPEEFRIGTTIAMFALFGSLTQGIRPLFRKGNWILPILMVGLAVLLHQIAEFVLISFVRGNFQFSPDIWFKMVFSSGAATVMAPFILYLISRSARKCGYQLEYEQLMFKKASYGYQI